MTKLKYWRQVINQDTLVWAWLDLGLSIGAVVLFISSWMLVQCVADIIVYLMSVTA